MKKILACTLFCITAFIIFAQEINIGESYSGDFQYRNEKAHITISPDAESPRHFSAVIITGNDTLEYHYFSMQNAINLNDLEKSEKDKKIIRDGLCIVKQPDKRTETSYEDGEKSGLEHIYKNGILFSESVFEKNKQVKDKVFYPSGKLWAEMRYKHAKGIGDDSVTEIVECYESGKLKRREVYSSLDDKMERKNYTEEGKDTLFACPFMNMPAFPGGRLELMRYISQNLKYPKTAAQNRIDGRVMVRFSIEKDGSLSNIEVVQGVSTDLDMEAIRVVKSMPKWRPGSRYGELTVMKFTLPVLFRLRR